MKCDTYLIGQWKCDCWRDISTIRKNNERIRISDDRYPIKNPFYSKRILTKREKHSIEYNKRLSSINWMPW